MIPLYEVIESYYDCRRHKRGTRNEQDFEINVNQNLLDLCRELNNGTYRIGRSIAFIVKRPKIREIFAADFKDRIVHHFIIRHLESYFEKEFIDDNYNCRKGKGVLYGVMRLEEKIRVASDNYTRDDLYIGKFDMKGFFMSIHKETMWLMLEKFITEKYDGPYKEEILYLTKLVVMHRPQLNCFCQSPEKDWEELGKGKSLFTIDPDYGLPIGNLTSQSFANFYLHKFDWMMVKLFPLGYGRYVDDFYVLARTKEEITSRVNYIKDYLMNNLKVTLHKDKVYIQHYKKGVKFTGSVVKNGRIYTGNGTIAGMYRAIHWYNLQPASEEMMYNFFNTLNSYFGFLVHTKSYKIRKKVWNLVDRKWKSRFWITKDYSKVCIYKDCKKEIKNLKRVLEGKLEGIENEVY